MTTERFARLKKKLLCRQTDLTVLADRIHKLQNVSAIIRTCDAVGIGKLHVVSSGGGFRRYHMAAGGAKRWVDIVEHASTRSACKALEREGMRILVAHSGPGSIDYRSIDYTEPTAIAVGNELSGPDPAVLDCADAAISIPMHGLVESLNVSVAAAVILFEAERQRGEAGLYERPRTETTELGRTLFEWAHPKIAERCRMQGIAYPPLDENGDLQENPFARSQGRPKRRPQGDP